jgi:nucleoid-associated protein YgaU
MRRVHTVVDGDTLFGLALKFYGDGNKSGIIAQASGIRDPNLIFPGQVLQIPDLEPAPSPPPEPSPQPAPAPQPESPPQPIDFRLLRPADLVNLQCTAIGCRITSDEAPPGGPTTTHTVVPGDTLWDLAQRFYGDPWLFPLIAAASHIPNPNLIFPGQVLVIPPRPAPPASAPPTVYTVVPGDTLWDIASRFYGNPFRYPEIAAANRIPNPDLIFPDQRLVIPGLPGPAPDPAPSTGTRLVAVSEGAHLIVRFGVQNIFEQAKDRTDPRALARAANDSRVVFELPKGTETPFTVAGILHTLTTLSLRVPPLAIPPLKDGEKRPPEASVGTTAPAADQTAIEAPYRLIISPDVTEGFTHAAEAASAPGDSSRVELWHSRLGVREFVEGKFTGIDEAAAKHVRAVFARDDVQPESTEDFIGSLKRNDRPKIVRQSADPTVEHVAGQRIEPVPFDVERLYLSSLGAWLDWRVAWPRAIGDELAAYRHLATLGRDSYVRVETPIYLFPFGHRGTYVTVTERKIEVSNDDQAAYLSQRDFIVLREHTRTYSEEQSRQMPFTSISIDPIVSPDLEPVEKPATPDVFIPHVKGVPYRWKVTGIDHAGREITMMTPLVAVPRGHHLDTADHVGALGKWNKLLTGSDDGLQANGTIDVGGVEVAFAKPKNRDDPGDTTLRTQYIDFTGVAAEDTSTPSMPRAHVTIPALAAINKVGGPVPVKYHGLLPDGRAEMGTYVDKGFDPDTNKGQLFLVLEDENKLDFAGGSDRGGGFIEPSVAVNAISRTQGAVGDKGEAAGGIKDGQFNAEAFLGTALPKLFGLFDLNEILTPGTLAQAPKLITEQLDLIGSVASEYSNLLKGLEQARTILDKDIAVTETPGAKQRLQDVRAQVQQALDALAGNPVQPLLTALASGVPADAAGPAGQILGALNAIEAVRSNRFLPAYLRALIERPYRAVEGALKTAQDATKLANALQSAVNGSTIRYEWNPPITGWPKENQVFIPEKGVFIPEESDGLAIAVEIRTSKDGEPQSDVSAQLRNFKLQLLPGEPLMAMTFSRIGFRVSTGGKPEVDVQFDGMEFLGPLGFIEKLRQVIPFDGFADPPYVDINTEGATAGFDLALPSVAVGVFTLENISLAADCRVPFLGEAVTVGFGFCTKESPFRLTVMAIGGGGWVGIRLAPKGLVMLEVGLEAGAALSLDFGVASGSVSVMIGVYLRLEDERGQLTAFFRIRGEVEVLGIASASITLEMSLTYDFPSGKLIGRASLRVEVEVLFFSASVEITCERKLATRDSDPSLADIMPPDQGGQAIWDQYFSSFAIGA